MTSHQKLTLSIDVFLPKKNIRPNFILIRSEMMEA